MMIDYAKLMPWTKTTAGQDWLNRFSARASRVGVPEEAQSAMQDAAHPDAFGEGLELVFAEVTRRHARSYPFWGQHLPSPRFSEMTAHVATSLKNGYARDLMRVYSSQQSQPPAVLGAASLLALFSRRMGPESELFQEIYLPEILIAGLDVKPRSWASGRHDYLPLDANARYDAFEDLLSDEYITLAKTGMLRSFQEIVMEFGGGARPFAVEYALRHPDALVASVDAAPRPISWEKLRAQSMPDNVTMIGSRAEMMAYYAANMPFVDRAIMVDPNDALMLLSALLMVKSGGEIDIYKRYRFGALERFLDRAELPSECIDLPGDSLEIPSSRSIHRGDPAVHYRIRVPSLRDQSHVWSYVPEGAMGAVQNPAAKDPGVGMMHRAAPTSAPVAPMLINTTFTGGVEGTGSFLFPFSLR